MAVLLYCVSEEGGYGRSGFSPLNKEGLNQVLNIYHCHFAPGSRETREHFFCSDIGSQSPWRQNAYTRILRSGSVRKHVPKAWTLTLAQTLKSYDIWRRELLQLKVVITTSDQSFGCTSQSRADMRQQHSGTTHKCRVAVANILWGSRIMKHY